MFKKRSSALLLILSVCFFVTLFSMFRVSQKNISRHQKVVHSLQPKEADHYGTTQRHAVKKDVWITKDGDSFHYIIKSGDSILHLNQLRTKQTHATEEMNDITCYMQQKKFFQHLDEENSNEKGAPMQQVCILKMNTGTYNYFSKNFSGNETQISVFEIPGHTLDDAFSTKNSKKILEGKCDSVMFTLDQHNKPQLKTQNLKAKVYTEQETL